MSANQRFPVLLVILGLCSRRLLTQTRELKAWLGSKVEWRWVVQVLHLFHLVEPLAPRMLLAYGTSTSGAMTRS